MDLKYEIFEVPGGTEIAWRIFVNKLAHPTL